MKLLLDENLSDKIVPQILDLYPGSSHVKAHELLHTDDAAIWSFARKNEFVIVSKDSDFHQRSLVHGAPPKLVFLRSGNGPTAAITRLLRSDFALISEFLRSGGDSDMRVGAHSGASLRGVFPQSGRDESAQPVVSRHIPFVLAHGARTASAKRQTVEETGKRVT